MEFEDMIFHRYLHTSKMAFHRTHERVDRVGLYRGQPNLLFALWERDGQSKKELSENIGRKAATITKMVGRLENNGFVESRRDAEDSRVSRVYLTEKGRSVEDEVRRIYENLRSDIFDGFTEDELAVFDTFMLRIQENILEKLPCEGGDGGSSEHKRGHRHHHRYQEFHKRGHRHHGGHRND